MCTVVDTQATNFLDQRQQHQVVMKDRGGGCELKRPSTNAPSFFFSLLGGDSKTILECGSHQSGCTLGEMAPHGEEEKEKGMKAGESASKVLCLLS